MWFAATSNFFALKRVVPELAPEFAAVAAYTYLDVLATTLGQKPAEKTEKNRIDMRFVKIIQMSNFV